MGTKKKIINNISDIWIECRNKKYIVHITYDTRDRSSDVDYAAATFEEAQKIFAAATSQDVEDLRNWEKLDNRGEDVW